jgi:GTP cyclohydrolase IA
MAISGYDMQHDLSILTAAVWEIIQGIGDNPHRAGLRDTPARVIASWGELFSGYHQDPKEVLKVFEDGAENYDEMIICRDIDFTSFCEHHLLPFTGKAHVGYVPHQTEPRIVGLSKLARLVDVFAKRLQVQERLTSQVAFALFDILRCPGAACVVEAMHLCMACRGVRKQNAVMVTSSLLGVFRKPEVRAEFLTLIGRPCGGPAV